MHIDVFGDLDTYLTHFAGDMARREHRARAAV